MSTNQTFPVPLTPAQLNAAESAQWRQIVAQALVDARVAVPAFLVDDMDSATQTVTVADRHTGARTHLRRGQRSGGTFHL